MRDNGDFLKDLRAEIAAGQHRRTVYVTAKLSFLLAIFGLGSVKLSALPLTPLLYLTTLVVFVFDLYILGEDFGVKRVGCFLRLNPITPEEERRWERTARANRDPVSGLAGFLSSIFALCAAVIGLWPSEHDKLFYWIWLFVSLLVLVASSIYGQVLIRRLRKLESYLTTEEFQTQACGQPDTGDSQPMRRVENT